MVDVFVVPHLAASGSACGDWYERRCVLEAFVVDWRLSRSRE